MSYFKTCITTLRALAKGGRYEDVAGFLVLARHASGLSHGGFEPYSLSGAGVNAIHEKAGLSEEQARGVIGRLQEAGVIRPATAEARQASHHARWEMRPLGSLDVELPHALVDVSRDGKIDSALRRLKRHRIVDPAYADVLKAVSDTELRLDTLMLLVSLYARSAMCSYGGISPRCLQRLWHLQSQEPQLGSVRWGAEPAKTDSTYSAFMAESLPHIPAGKKGELSDTHMRRFWNAWGTIKSSGLVYETVALYDTLPDKNPQARLQYTLRVNDWHAGAAVRDGDASLMRSFERAGGTKLAYYTWPGNARNDDEAMWVLLPPETRGVLVGVWRLRFRPHTRDSGAWAEQEELAVARVSRQVIEAERAAMAALAVKQAASRQGTPYRARVAATVTP